MKWRIDSLLPILIVLFLAGLTLWLRVVVEQSAPEKSAPRPDEADAIVENINLVRYGSDGKPLYRVAARRMLHFATNDIAELEFPRFTKVGTDGVLLTVTSNTATMQQATGEARFRGNVLVVRDATAARPALKAQTESLHLLAEKDLLTTDQAVSITEGNTRFSGIGMELNRRTRQFTLHSQVKGTYDAVKR
jgi:lipopolysaccharide export system protein LptC